VPGQLAGDSCQASLIGFREVVPVIGCEIAGRAQRDIGWIKVYEIPLLSFTDNTSEVSDLKSNILQSLRRVKKSFLITDLWVFVAAERHVELSASILAIESIVTSLIEVDEPRSPIDGA
jgi:hypothetical protein